MDGDRAAGCRHRFGCTLRQCLERYRRQIKSTGEQNRTDTLGHRTLREEAGKEKAAPGALHQAVSESDGAAGKAAPAVMPQCSSDRTTLSALPLPLPISLSSLSILNLAPSLALRKRSNARRTPRAVRTKSGTRRARDPASPLFHIGIRLVPLR